MDELVSRRLRSSVTKEEREQLAIEKRKKEEERMNRPPIEFSGKILYIQDFIDAAAACDKMIQLVESTEGFLTLGFDIEWPFSFQTGSGKASVIQISPNTEICYIIQCNTFKRLPQSLNVLLSHPKTRITGVNIKNDIRKLSRDFTGLNAEKIIENCIDSGVFANKILPFQQRWSMEKLVNYLLKMSISKDKKVRMSKWNVSPLSEEQLKYAATDAYASLVLYNELKQREQLLNLN